MVGATVSTVPHYDVRRLCRADVGAIVDGRLTVVERPTGALLTQADLDRLGKPQQTMVRDGDGRVFNPGAALLARLTEVESTRIHAEFVRAVAKAIGASGYDQLGGVWLHQVDRAGR